MEWRPGSVPDGIPKAPPTSRRENRSDDEYGQENEWQNFGWRFRLVRIQVIECGNEQMKIDQNGHAEIECGSHHGRSGWCVCGIVGGSGR
jgi:hypothetical protein